MLWAIPVTSAVFTCTISIESNLQHDCSKMTNGPFNTETNMSATLIYFLSCKSTGGMCTLVRILDTAINWSNGLSSN